MSKELGAQFETSSHATDDSFVAVISFIARIRRWPGGVSCYVLKDKHEALRRKNTFRRRSGAGLDSCKTARRPYGKQSGSTSAPSLYSREGEPGSCTGHSEAEATGWTSRQSPNQNSMELRFLLF